MRPVVVTAVLLLVVLMSMSASAEWTPDSMCRTYYPVNNCRKNVGPGWFQYGPNRCVKAFHNKHLSHRDANKACKKFPNGEMVSIHSINELQLVECAMYRATTKRLVYWIGMWRSSKGLIWTDGTKHDYSHWASEEPNNVWWQENCVQMNAHGWGFWIDYRCYHKQPYVCEVKL